MSIQKDDIVRNNALFKERANELIEMVRRRHPDAHFTGPTYWEGDELLLFDAYFDEGEDFELENQLSERETDILLDDNIWLGVLLLPLSAYKPNGQNGSQNGLELELDAFISA